MNSFYSFSIKFSNKKKIIKKVRNFEIQFDSGRVFEMLSKGFTSTHWSPILQNALLSLSAICVIKKSVFVWRISSSRWKVASNFIYPFTWKIAYHKICVTIHGRCTSFGIFVFYFRSVFYSFYFNCFVVLLRYLYWRIFVAVPLFTPHPW